MRKLSSWFKWLDDNLVKILVGGFIFLIPLYPKIPLRMINYTYIAIRLEDLYVAFLIAVYVIQLIRGKLKLNKKFFLLFFLYWLAVFLSSLWAVYINKTVSFKHLALLHSLRRIEYMAVFFIASSIIKTKKEFFFYLSLIFLALFFVTFYGIGQKFFGWPAVQTMNPEYAKGYLLYLTPEARISSTFAGHYDLAAYLIFLIPFVWGFYFLRQNFSYLFLFFLSLLTLVFTASRISYSAYLLSTFPFLLFLKKFKHLAFALLLTLVLTFSSQNLTSRFKRTFQVKQIFVNQKTGQVIVPQKITAKELPAGSFYIGLIPNGQTNVATNEVKLLREKILDEIRTEAKKKGKKLTAEEEELLTASLAARLKPINTFVSDISFATRLQIEWPRAIKAFLKNPILGTGPSSITEATDNDYLRSLGEVGLLGTTLLVIIFYNIIKTIILSFEKIKNKEKPIYLAFLFALFGLLVNAGYIDVFEASKVAFTFWLIAGLFIGSLYQYEKS
ncbi:MAG: O-antigen ligase family protein [Microgenomates group bacterium]